MANSSQIATGYGYLVARRRRYQGVWGLGAAFLRRNTLGRSHVFGRVDVEEGVDRLRRPVGDGDAMARGPDLDLVQALNHQRFAQVLAQLDRPQAHHGMPPLA